MNVQLLIHIGSCRCIFTGIDEEGRPAEHGILQMAHDKLERQVGWETAQVRKQTGETGGLGNCSGKETNWIDRWAGKLLR